MKTIEQNIEIYKQRVNTAKELLEKNPKLNSFIRLRLAFRIAYYEKLIRNLQE